MLRTSIFIEESDKRLLQLEAQRTGKSEAELIRQGIRQILKSSGIDGELPSFVGVASVGGDASKDKRSLRKEWHKHLDDKSSND